jgi:hypothetical protein
MAHARESSVPAGGRATRPPAGEPLR